MKAPGDRRSPRDDRDRIRYRGSSRPEGEAPLRGQIASADHRRSRTPAPSSARRQHRPGTTRRGRHRTPRTTGHRRTPAA